jgi:hypothetical protein
MNLSPGNPQNRDPSEDRLLELLVDGELPEAGRRELLLRLENEPDGWRRCALAFLEAQVWRQALPSVATTGAAPGPLVARYRSRPHRTFWRLTARSMGLAATLAAAFMLGWIYHGGLERTTPSELVNQQTGTVAVGPAQVLPEQRGKVTTEHSNPTELAKPPASIDPLVKHLQQEGYVVETEKRLVLLEAKDGRKLKLPMKEVRIRYIGDRIY